MASSITGVPLVSDCTTEPLTVVDANIQISPLTATNGIGAPHTFTAHVNVNDGTANWGDGFYTSYGAGGTSTNWNLLSGYWGDTSLPGHGPLLLEGTQVGAVIYRVDGGDWKPVSPNTTVEGTHTVQVAYNDRPGSYDDNSGSLSLTVVRTKA